MGAKVKVTLQDKGNWRAAIAQAFKANANAYVKVGVFGAAGEEPVEPRAAADGTAKAKGTPITVLTLATIHEFGTGRIPARSFIRSYYDSNVDRLKAMLGTLTSNALKRAVASGKYIDDGDRRMILEKIGIKMTAEIQGRISGGEITPPLAESTIDRKGSSTPLIDTGQLRSSIAYKVSLKDDGQSVEGSD